MVAGMDVSMSASMVYLNQHILETPFLKAQFFHNSFSRPFSHARLSNTSVAWWDSNYQHVDNIFCRGAVPPRAGQMPRAAEAVWDAARCCSAG